MIITIEIEEQEQEEGFIPDFLYEATLISVKEPFVGWEHMVNTHSDEAEDEFDALDDLMDTIQYRVGNNTGQAESERIKLAAWNKNVMDWQHVRSKYQSSFQTA